MLTLIMPAYNEESSLEKVLPETIAFCKQNNYKLIVVNDGSTDNTKKIIERFSSEDCVTIMANKINAGYGAAIKKGIRQADTGFIATLDADGQHIPEDIEKLFKRTIETGADMVVGNRGNNPGNYRGIGKWLIRKVAGMLMPLTVHDINSGMKLYNTALAKKYIALCPDTMAFSDIILLTFVYMKNLVVEVPIAIKPRTGGKSAVNTMTAIDTLKEIMNIVVLFNPTRIFFPAGIFIIIASIAWNIHIFMQGRGLSTGALFGIITGINFFIYGLLAHQISCFRKEALE